MDAAEKTPDLSNIRRLSGNVRHLSRMLYMEEVVQQKSQTTNEQLKIIDAANQMERSAKRKYLAQRLEHLEKVLELERQSGELSSTLKDAESERLKLKYYISEENVSRISRYIEASELLSSRVRRDLLDRESQLQRLQDLLLSAWGRLRSLPQSEQEFSSHLQQLSEFLSDSGRRVPCQCELDGQWDKVRKALKTKEEEIAYLQHLLREQKEEMEKKRAALEGKLLRQAKDRDEDRDRDGGHLCEKDQSIRRKFSEKKSQVRKELSEKEEQLRKELSDIEQELKEELSLRYEQLGKELSQKEESLKTKLVQMSKDELSERNKSIRKELRERQDVLAQRQDVLEKELVESSKKSLSDSEEQFQKELSEREKSFSTNLTKEQITTELWERNDSFRRELSGRADDFREELFKMEERLKKELSDRRERFIQTFLDRENVQRTETSEDGRELAATQEEKQPKAKRAVRDKDKSSKMDASEKQQKLRPSSVPPSDIRVRR